SLGVPLQCKDFLAGLSIPHHYYPGVRSAGNAFAVRAERQGGSTTLENEKLLAGLGIDYRRTSDQTLPVGTEGHASVRAAAGTLDGEAFLAGLSIPHLQFPCLASRTETCQASTVRAEGHLPDTVGGSFD